MRWPGAHRVSPANDLFCAGLREDEATAYFCEVAGIASISSPEADIDEADGLARLKARVRAMGARFPDREQRARRLFVEERAASLHFERDREFAIRTAISGFFGVPYSAVAFAGSAQLGFSVHKDRLFEPGVSDLDAACVDVGLFQRAWIDVIEATRSFTDATPFGRRPSSEIKLFKDQILRRGMIRLDAMPRSTLSLEWNAFMERVGRDHAAMFQRVSLAIYMNEYAFCWKQDSALTTLMEPTR